MPDAHNNPYQFEAARQRATAEKAQQLAAGVAAREQAAEQQRQLLYNQSGSTVGYQGSIVIPSRQLATNLSEKTPRPITPPRPSGKQGSTSKSMQPASGIQLKPSKTWANIGQEQASRAVYHQSASNAALAAQRRLAKRDSKGNLRQ